MCSTSLQNSQSRHTGARCTVAGSRVLERVSERKAQKMHYRCIARRARIQARTHTHAHAYKHTSGSNEIRLHTFFSHAMGARQRMDVLGRRRDGYARLHNSASSPAVCWNRTCCRSLVLLRRNVTRQTGRRVEASGLSTRKAIFQSTLASVLDPFLA